MMRNWEGVLSASGWILDSSPQPPSPSASATPPRNLQTQPITSAGLLQNQGVVLQQQQRGDVSERGGGPVSATRAPARASRPPSSEEAIDGAMALLEAELGMAVRSRSTRAVRRAHSARAHAGAAAPPPQQQTLAAGPMERLLAEAAAVAALPSPAAVRAAALQQQQTQENQAQQHQTPPQYALPQQTQQHCSTPPQYARADAAAAQPGTPSGRSNAVFAAGSAPGGSYASRMLRQQGNARAAATATAAAARSPVGPLSAAAAAAAHAQCVDAQEQRVDAPEQRADVQLRCTPAMPATVPEEPTERRASGDAAHASSAAVGGAASPSASGHWHGPMQRREQALLREVRI
eukprot:350428-Chlamydomonas_euryale.AAC.1